MEETKLKEKKMAYHLPKTTKLRLYRLLSLLILLCFACAFLLNLSSTSCSSTSPLPLIASKTTFLNSLTTSPPRPPPSTIVTMATCSSLIDHAGVSTAPPQPLLCCDRSHYRTDVCYMSGDIRTSTSSRRTILLHGAAPTASSPEKIRPYPRKWEKGLMTKVDELTLRPAASDRCDVRHSVPGLVFSTGGYTGNVYHEFNDGLIPLYITAEKFAGEVVLVVAEFHEWWFTKYRSLLEKLSRHEVVDLRKDKRVHCFPEMIVGLRIHGELAVDSTLMPTGKGIRDFQSLLNQAYDYHPEAPPTTAAALLPLSASAAGRRRPKLAILVRNRSRRLLNLRDVLRLSRRAGFDAELLAPKRSTPLAEIRRTLAASDAMLAVHGAAVTHFLFMRPGSVLIQVVPLGLGWPAEAYYGEPARRLGLQYLAYNVTPAESSLSKVYGRRDPVLVDTAAVTRKGWAETKRVYMDGQDVEVDIKRFGKLLQEARARVVRSRGSAR